MKQKDIVQFAIDLQASATLEGSEKACLLIGNALRVAKVLTSDGVMAQIGGCIVQLAESNHISQADAARVLAELLLGKARAQ
jgi:hypothetical protein